MISADAQNRHILGLPEMDEQHRYLYGLFDMLENAWIKKCRYESGIITV